MQPHAPARLFLRARRASLSAGAAAVALLCAAAPAGAVPPTTNPITAQQRATVTDVCSFPVEVAILSAGRLDFLAHPGAVVR